MRILYTFGPPSAERRRRAYRNEIREKITRLFRPGSQGIFTTSGKRSVVFLSVALNKPD